MPIRSAERLAACRKLLEYAEHIKSLTIECASYDDAYSIRFLCYRIRSSLRLVGQPRFEDLKFQVRRNHLIITKQEFQDALPRIITEAELQRMDS